MQRVFVLLLLSVFLVAFTGSVEARPYYGGGYHTYSHGGNYAGGYGKSHRGGHYHNAATGNRYGRHK